MQRALKSTKERFRRKSKEKDVENVKRKDMEEFRNNDRRKKQNKGRDLNYRFYDQNMTSDDEQAIDLETQLENDTIVTDSLQDSLQYSDDDDDDSCWRRH